MPFSGKRFTIAKIAAALRTHDGLVPRAAEELGTSRQAIQQRIDRSAELQGVLVEIDADLRMTAKGAIYDALKSGDMATVRWFAERKMRDEGFGTRIEGSLDTAQLEKIAEAIAAGGVATIRAVQAAIAGSRVS